jgi:hypothetical protein
MLRIDGTSEHGELSGFATRGPWAVFDTKKQDWLATGLAFRWMAQLYIWVVTR